MAIKHIICKGIGFADVDDNLKYIPTHGFTPATVAAGGPGFARRPTHGGRPHPHIRALQRTRRRAVIWWLLPGLLPTIAGYHAD